MVRIIAFVLALSVSNAALATPALQQLTNTGEGQWRPTEQGDPPDQTGLWMRKDVADRQIILHNYATLVKNTLEEAVTNMDGALTQAQKIMRADNEAMKKMGVAIDRLESIVQAPPAMSDWEKAAWIAGSVILGGLVGFGAASLR